MSTQFPTPDAALDYGLSTAGVTRESAQLVEDPDLCIVPVWVDMLGSEDPEFARLRAEAIEGQVGYRGRDKDGRDLALVVDRFRDGWCVWSVTQNGGASRM